MHNATSAIVTSVPRCTHYMWKEFYLEVTLSIAIGCLNGCLHGICQFGMPASPPQKVGLVSNVLQFSVWSWLSAFTSCTNQMAEHAQIVDMLYIYEYSFINIPQHYSCYALCTRWSDGHRKHLYLTSPHLFHTSRSDNTLLSVYFCTLLCACIIFSASPSPAR